MTEYRASFDAAIRFGNGGDLTAHGFRVDVPSPDTDEDAIAALFVASLGLLMTDSITITNVEIFAEPHKGTGEGRRITVVRGCPRPAGLSNSTTSFAPGWSPIRDFPARRSPRT